MVSFFFLDDDIYEFVYYFFNVSKYDCDGVKFFWNYCKFILDDSNVKGLLLYEKSGYK